uniref:Uncharacterized protein n=1 Tax=Amphimedon queenslandica TaxID=400682 RepID=A0A1X7USB9_AMPQE
MASQTNKRTCKTAVRELISFIHGYHAYMEVWTPYIREGLLIKRDPDNIKDGSAVCVLKDGEIFGQIPFNI